MDFGVGFVSVRVMQGLLWVVGVSPGVSLGVYNVVYASKYF